MNAYVTRKEAGVIFGDFRGAARTRFFVDRRLINGASFSGIKRGDCRVTFRLAMFASRPASLHWRTRD